IRALTRLGLTKLVPMLDTASRWERKLSEDEQQAVAFARLSLHKPPWLIIDEVLDGLDDATYDRVSDLLATDLKDMGLMQIDRSDPHDPMFTRTLHLVKGGETRMVPRRGAGNDTTRQHAGR